MCLNFPWCLKNGGDSICRRNFTFKKTFAGLVMFNMKIGVIKGNPVLAQTMAVTGKWYPLEFSLTNHKT